MPRLSFVLFVALGAMQLTGCVSSVKTAPSTYCSQCQGDQGALLQQAPNSSTSPAPNSSGYDEYDDQPLHKSNQLDSPPPPVQRTGFFPTVKAKSVSLAKTTEEGVRNMFD